MAAIAVAPVMRGLGGPPEGTHIMPASMLVRTLLRGGLLGALATFACAAGAQAARPSKLFHAFTHVVIIQQENRTLDNMFNGFPGADTVRVGLRNGTIVPLRRERLQPSPGLDHSHGGFVLDYDSGKMDGFDHKVKAGNDTAYQYVDPDDVANYWTLASRFTLADEVFQMNIGPSLPAHVYLVAAQGGYPLAIAGNTGAGETTGCFGSADVEYVDLRTQFPGTKSKGLACVDVPTVLDMLDEHGIGWRYYAPDDGDGLAYWSAPDYIRHIAFGPDHRYLINPETTILSDIQNGALQPVSYVSPGWCTSDHPRRSQWFPTAGPRWVAEITNAIGSSQYWNNTLILVTWDDWGGFYDHVRPTIIDANSYGFRTPLLIVSAYPAAPGAVDHTRRSQASIITAIEAVFGLGSLGQLDSLTDDLHSDFDFRQPVPYGTPLPAGTPPPSCGPTQGGG